MTATATAPMVDTSREVLLIDLSAIFRACWHANADGDLSVAFQGTLGGVRRCIGQRNAFVAVCCDGRGSFRKELYAEYKANREKQPASMYDVLRRVKERLVADGLLLWEVDTFEADDLIAAAVDAAKFAGHPICIASHDKDLLQLMAPGVRFLKTSTWEEFDHEGALAKFGVQPAQMVDLLALMGDKSDNIPGIAGVGPKTAADLLTKFGTWERILDQLAADGSKVGTANLAKKLAEGVEAVKLGKSLIELRADAPIKFDEIYERRETKTLVEVDPMAEMISETAGQPEQGELPVVPPAPSVPANETGLAPLVKAEVMPASFDMALEPQSLGQAERMGAVLQNSRLYPKLANDAAIFAVIVRGRELGLGALVSLDVFSVVEGRLCPSAHFIISKAKADPDAEYFYCEESTDKSATWVTKNRRNPRETRLTYTIEQARAAGLIKERGNWATRPAEMLRKTAGVQLARMEYPESALGLYADMEMDGAA